MLGRGAVDASFRLSAAGLLGSSHPADQQSPAARLCPAGSYCPRASSEAIQCGNGTYCPEGSPLPSLCPSGTYRDAVGGTVVGDCTTCPAGVRVWQVRNAGGLRGWHGSKNNGALSCVNCAPGTFQDEKARRRACHVRLATTARRARPSAHARAARTCAMCLSER